MHGCLTDRENTNYEGDVLLGLLEAGEGSQAGALGLGALSDGFHILFLMLAKPRS